jgi:hypothetical protein
MLNMAASLQPSAHHRVVECVAQGDGAVQLAGDDDLVVKDLGHTASFADHEGGSQQEFLGAPAVDADGEVGLGEPQVGLGAQGHATERVGGVAPVR